MTGSMPVQDLSTVHQASLILIGDTLHPKWKLSYVLFSMYAGNSSI